MSYCGGPEPLEMEVSWDRSHKITGKAEDSEGCNPKVGLVPIREDNSIHWRPVDLTSQPAAHDFSYSRSLPRRGPPPQQISNLQTGATGGSPVGAFFCSSSQIISVYG
jgi:hypothetical protein